jgi:DNA-binding response OmpR family regulator
VNKRILIAEDDMGILEAMQIMLEDEGYEVTTTVDGQTVQAMHEELPDLLLLDIWLAGMDGAQICKQLKSQELTRHIPIILCSANAATQELAKNCGADDFIVKPFEMTDLLAKVDKHTRTLSGYPALALSTSLPLADRHQPDSGIASTTT